MDAAFILIHNQTESYILRGTDTYCIIHTFVHAYIPAYYPVLKHGVLMFP